MEKRKNVVYMKVTADEYELSVGVSESISELARMTGKKNSELQSIFSRIRHGTKGSKIYRIVEIDEDLEDDSESEKSKESFADN